MMTSQLGTYALVLTSHKTSLVGIGSLGTLELQPGFYVYVGSASGRAVWQRGLGTIPRSPPARTGTSTISEPPVT